MHRIAAFLLALSIASGAFGAHALKGSLSKEYQEIYNTASLYLMINSVGILAALSSGLFRPETTSRVIPVLFTGTVIFSGSLYLLVLLDIKKFGMITPLGGVMLLTGWAYLAFKG